MSEFPFSQSAKMQNRSSRQAVPKAILEMNSIHSFFLQTFLTNPISSPSNTNYMIQAKEKPKKLRKLYFRFRVHPAGRSLFSAPASSPAPLVRPSLNISISKHSSSLSLFTPNHRPPGPQYVNKTKRTDCTIPYYFVTIPYLTYIPTYAEEHDTNHHKIQIRRAAFEFECLPSSTSKPASKRAASATPPLRS